MHTACHQQSPSCAASGRALPPLGQLRLKLWTTGIEHGWNPAHLIIFNRPTATRCANAGKARRAGHGRQAVKGGRHARQAGKPGKQAGKNQQQAASSSSRQSGMQAGRQARQARHARRQAGTHARRRAGMQASRQTGSSRQPSASSKQASRHASRQAGKLTRASCDWGLDEGCGICFPMFPASCFFTSPI